MKSETRRIYDSLEKIDAHLHQNIDRTELQMEAKSEGFALVTVNTEVPFFPPVRNQLQTALSCRKNGPAPLNAIATFTTSGLGKDGWVESALREIRDGLDAGAVGIKVWKNIGMELRNSDGSFVMIDHPSFEPILDELEKSGIPLLAHLGEPRNCWLPIEEMTVTSDRDYFSAHPQYHMYLHREFPSYREQLNARDRILERHPDLRFVGAHLASLEWSVDEVASWLDRHPICGVDLAERVCHLQHQASDDPARVRAFVETYQDRIIYGTDQIDDGTLDGDRLRQVIRKKWHDEFRFFAEDSVQSAWNVARPFQGLGLGEKILAKLFRDNAIAYYPSLKL